MAKNFQILMMIFCLGIFVFPKQNILVANEKADCCKTEKNCCDKNKTENKDCHSNENDKKSCEGNCANCHSCCTSIVLSLENKNNFEAIIFQNLTSNKVENFYMQPHFSTLFISIWQPPKIG